MKKRILLVSVISVVMLILVVCGIYCDENNCINEIQFQINQTKKEKISLFKNSDIYYLFVPSHVSLKDLNIEYTPGCSVIINKQTYSSKTSLQNLDLNKAYTLEIRNFLGVVVSREKLVIMKSKNLPTLYINLANGSIEDINSNQNIEKTGVCSLIERNKNVNYSGRFSSIHGRGNSSWWTQEKKPYTIEFENDVDLLGMGSAKKWILLSNGHDESNLRNKIIFDTAKKYGLNYSVDSEFIDLYVNGVYNGLYLLSEKVEVQPNRINIQPLQENTSKINSIDLKYYDIHNKRHEGLERRYYNILNNPSDNTGGYLFEMIMKGRQGLYDNNYNTHNNSFTLLYPKFPSEKQIDYIANLSLLVEDHLNKKDISNYIDINSFVKYYLIQEVFGNMDENSFYFYKDSNFINPKIYAGPAWDFDISLGNICFSSNPNPKALYISTWGWYKQLCKNPVFKKELEKEYSSKFRHVLKEVLEDKIDKYAEVINDSYNMNFARWNSINNYENSLHFKDLSCHVDAIKSYLRNRVDFCNKIWINKDRICSIRAISTTDKREALYFSLNYGDDFLSLPKLQNDGYIFLGWYDVDTNEPFSPVKRLVKDLEYEARWEKNKSKIDTIDSNKEVKNKFSTLKNKIINNKRLVICSLLFIIMFIFVIINVIMDVLENRKSLVGNKHEK